jgi:hypothetical protein
MQSKRSEREVVVTLRLPRELHERLKHGAGSGGFAAEVRRRLEASFQADPLVESDPKSREVVAAITWSLNALRPEGDRGRWHEDPKVFPEARTAVLGIIDRFRPEGAPDTTDTSISTFLAGIALLHVRGEL